MSAKAILEAPIPVEDTSIHTPAASRRKPEIKRVVPVVRWAILVRHRPRLSAHEPEKVEKVIRHAWPEWKEAYHAAMADHTFVPPHLLHIDREEDVRLRIDGKTPMIDFPKIQSAGTRNRFDLRHCAALCLDEYSSKIWSRVGPPVGRNRGCSSADLPVVLDEYRAIAKSSGQWFHDAFFALADQVLSANGHARTGAGFLEVTTLGLQIDGDPTTDDPNTWLFDHGRPNLDDPDLRRFMAMAGGLSYDIRELEEREPTAFWMSLPMAVQLSNGDLASRTVLYYVRPVGEVVQVVGIGLDDSPSGDLASEVALKVSRLVANRI